jgi:hypothetical protein
METALKKVRALFLRGRGLLHSRTGGAGQRYKGSQFGIAIVMSGGSSLVIL